MKAIRTLLADDHTIVREGLRALLLADSGIEVVGEAVNGREAVDLAMSLRPDVVVMDIAMPQLNGLEATSKIRAALPGTKVIILSAHSDDAYIDRVIAIGASGFLIKQTSAQILARAIHEVMEGKTFYSPQVSKRVREHYQRPEKAGGLLVRKATLMDKLNIHDTAGLTRYAIAQGIIESSVQVTIV
jgi:DNA-binding NarL/FixJ family response regulator